MVGRTAIATATGPFRSRGARMTDFVRCYGNARPTDTHLLARVVAVDGQIVEWLRRRTQRRTGRHIAMPIALTDSQLEQLTDAAAIIPHDQRDAFLRAVAAHLGDDKEVDDGDLVLALNAALDHLAMVIAS
jgi:hypothetical protein